MYLCFANIIFLIFTAIQEVDINVPILWMKTLMLREFSILPKMLPQTQAVLLQALYH